MVVCKFAQKITLVQNIWPSVHKIRGTSVQISLENQFDFQRLDRKPAGPWREIGTLNRNFQSMNLFKVDTTYI